MKLALKIVTIACGCLFALWAIGRFTNTIQFYKIPTPSNEPTLMQDSYILASNLKKPRRFDFICFRFINEFSKTIYVKRLCGMSGDTLEIKNGDLFVNYKSVDPLLTLNHRYSISKNNLNYLLYSKVFDKKNIVEGTNLFIGPSDTTCKVLLNKEVASDKNINPTRDILPKGAEPGTLWQEFDATWNRDNFGPIIIPNDKYFVLGDSRENSEDSRYIGFINKSDWVGTVLTN
ncbi:MAG: signal peptidase I [Bacteroidia bacterium]